MPFNFQQDYVLLCNLFFKCDETCSKCDENLPAKKFSRKGAKENGTQRGRDRGGGECISLRPLHLCVHPSSAYFQQCLSTSFVR
jgi:hypothetical protein